MIPPMFESVASFGALCRSARRAARGKSLTLEAASFLFDLEPECLRLQRELLAGEYRPGPYRTFRIRDPKPRTISAAPFRDRVVHHALCAALEPAFEAVADADSYACRVGKGTTAALARAREFTRLAPCFLKLDVEHCFETIAHEVLKHQLRDLTTDDRLLGLADLFIDTGAPGSPPGRGLPIGNLTSQHFANFHLTALDHVVRELSGIVGYVRYMDDLLLFGERPALRIARTALQVAVPLRLRLTLKHRVTQLAPVATGVPFLGFRLFPGTARLDGVRARRFSARIRALASRTPEDRAAAAASLCAWAALGDTLAFRRSFFNDRGA